MKKNRTTVQTWLEVLFVTCFLVSNILASKLIKIPGIGAMTGAVIVFPITYILSDLFSEVYGYRASRETCYMAFAMNVLMVSVFALAIALPPAETWAGQKAFSETLGNTPRILCASLLGFLIGDCINDRVFRKMKGTQTSLKGFEARAIVSSFAGEMCDSCIFVPLAFFGEMPLKTMILMMFSQVCLKVGYEILILPVTKAVTSKVRAYEKNS